MSFESETVSDFKSGKWRSDDVKITEDVDFRSMFLSERLLQGLKNSGFEKPSPVQLRAIPLGRCGLDLIVQAKSGTGKTGVLAVIALDTLLETPSTQVLILAPTREIASQICGVIRSLGCAFPDLTCEVFIGGIPVSNDKSNLPNCQIVVGTPGRIKQLIDMEYLKTDSIRLFIVDEADRMFDKQFKKEINWIFSNLPSRKQIVALSATYPEELADFLSLYMEKPASVRINSKDPALLGITQYFYVTPFHPLPQVNDSAKFDVLLDILNNVPFSQCMIFCQKQTKSQDLADNLVLKDFPAVGICSALDQSRRLEIIHELKTFQCRVLVSTDLTARGIDAENVNLVVNFDMPYEGEVYLHRIGRAGRYGTRGISISLVSDGDEIKKLMLFQKKFLFRIYQLPDPIPSDLWDMSVILQARRIEELQNESSSLESSDLLAGNTTVDENPSESKLDGAPERNDSTTFVNHPEKSACNGNALENNGAAVQNSSSDEKCSSSEIGAAVINEEKQLVSSEKVFENTVVNVDNRVTDDQAASQKQSGLQDTETAKTTHDSELQIVGSGETSKAVCEAFVQVSQDSSMLHNLHEGNSTLSSTEMVADINTEQKMNSGIANTSTDEGVSSNNIGSENPDKSQNHDLDQVKIGDPGKMELEETAGAETLHRKVAISSLFQDWEKSGCDSEQEKPDFSDQDISNILIPLLSTNKTKCIQSCLSYDKLVDSLKHNSEVAVSSLIKQCSETSLSECMDVTETQLKIFENFISRTNGEYLSCVQEKFSKLEKDTVPCKRNEICSESLAGHNSSKNETFESVNAGSQSVLPLPIPSERRNVLHGAGGNPEERIEVSNGVCSPSSLVLQNNGQVISEVQWGKEYENTTKPNIPEKSYATSCSMAAQKSVECTKPSILGTLSITPSTLNDILEADVSTKKRYIPFRAEKGREQAKESSIGKGNINSSHKVQLTESEYDSLSRGAKHFRVVSLPLASCSSPKDNSPPKAIQTSFGLFPKQMPKVDSQSVQRKDKSKGYASLQERQVQKQRGNFLHASKISTSKQSSVDENEMTEHSSSLTLQNGEMGQKRFASNYTAVHPQAAKGNVGYRELKSRKSKYEGNLQNHHRNEVNSAGLDLAAFVPGFDGRQFDKMRPMKSRDENSVEKCHEDEMNSADFADPNGDIDYRKFWKVKSSKSKHKHSYQSCHREEVNSPYVNENPVNYAPSDYFGHVDVHEKCGPAWGYQNGVDYLPPSIGESDFRSCKQDASSCYAKSPCIETPSSVPYDCCCKMSCTWPRESSFHPFVPQYYKEYLESWYYMQHLTYGYHC